MKDEKLYQDDLLYEDDIWDKFRSEQSEKANVFIEHLKLQKIPLNLKQLFLDGLNGKHTEYFVSLVVLWSRSEQSGVMLNLQGISELTHWAIWSASECYEPDAKAEDFPQEITTEIYRTCLTLALEDDYKNIWRACSDNDAELETFLKDIEENK